MLYDKMMTIKDLRAGLFPSVSGGRLRLRRIGWFGLLGWLGAWFFLASGVQAHPLDEFYQVTFITVGTDRIDLKVELYTGILIAPQILSLIDTNQNEQISEAEARAYVERFLKDVTFELDQAATPLAITSLDFPSQVDLRAGVGIIRFTLSASPPAALPGAHQFYYHNRHLPDIATYVVNVLSDDPARVQLGRQEKDVFQASLRLDYTVNLEAAGAAEAVPEIAPAALAGPGPVSAEQERLTRYLYDPELSPALMLLVIGFSIILGGLHALTPGHGKTLVAAYLVGSRGTVRHAMVLGGIVTFTHTASVVVIGLLALLASQFIVPQVMVPVLEILSGLLVVYIGGQLIWTRWRDYRAGVSHHHHHAHDHHPHPHSHSHEPPHDHHHHHLPEQVKVTDLLALGISGGMIPCPEALGIMLIAIGLNRILFGLGMVIAFSVGLAAVLVLIGILLVRARSLLDRFGAEAGRWQSLLPLASAIIVTLLGIGIIIKGLIPYFVH